MDKAFTNDLQEGDVLNVARSLNGSLGISVVRAGTLLAAAGAISAPPLGREVQVRVPLDLAQAAQDIFRQRDPDFTLSKIPLEITVAGQVRLSLGGRFDMGPYDVFVEHPYFDQTGAVDECAALALRGTFSSLAANASAQLLGFGGGMELLKR